MGKAYYCDRCGELFNTAEVTCYKIVVSMGYSEEIKVDFCSECRDKIEDFLYGNDIEK